MHSFLDLSYKLKQTGHSAYSYLHMFQKHKDNGHESYSTGLVSLHRMAIEYVIEWQCVESTRRVAIDHVPYRRELSENPFEFRMIMKKLL